MKVAMYYTRPFETGGVEKTMLARAKMLSKKGYEITFVYASKDQPLDMLEQWSKIGNVVHVYYCTEIFDFAIYDSVYNLKKVKAYEYIQVINGCLVDSNENYQEVISFNKYIAVSEEAAKQFKERKNKECKIIPNIIDSEEITKLSKEKYDIPKAKYNFVTVSRLDPQKGFERIEKMLQELENAKVDYSWVFVGSNYLYPKYGEQIKQRFSKYKTKFVGKQDNPYKYMKNADYLVQLSDYESQCMVMYESLTLGTPVIATDFPNAVKELKDKGIVLKKDMSDLDINKILKSKFNFTYKYPTYEKEWLEVLKPFERPNIKFSIIIPNYNNAKWLDKCLTSVLNQTYKNYELIFVDDMSTDNSLEIVKKYYLEFVDSCKGIQVIPLEQKRLNGGSRNVGILAASGDYIMCLDSDDWLKNNQVLEMLNKTIRNEDVIFTGFDLYNGKEEGLYPFRPKYKNLYEAFINDVCAIWTKVVKTSILKETLFPEGTLAEDRVHHYRVVEKCKTFKCIEESTHVWNRSNKTSVTTDRNELWEASTIKHLAEMYLFIKRTNNDKYREYVTKKFNRQKQDLDSGIYHQL